MTDLPPMRREWLERTLQERDQRRENPLGGVQYFADEFDVVPTPRRDAEDVEAERIALYGRPVNPRL